MKRAALASVVGAVCPRRSRTAASAPVTFSKDVAPILQKACQNCHRPGAIAPMSLLTYQDARPWARSIKQKVTAREMPPWYIDRHVGITQVQGRSVADRRGDRDHREVGRCRARRRATRPTCRRRGSSRRGQVAHRQAGHGRLAAEGVRAARERARRVLRRRRRSGLHRRHVHRRGRDQAGGVQLQGRAPRDREHDRGRGRGSGRASSSTSTRSARTATSSRRIRAA